MILILSKFITFVGLSVLSNKTGSLISIFDNDTLYLFINCNFYIAMKVSDFPQNRENPFAKQALVKIGSALVSKRVIGANKDESAVLKAVDQYSGEILGNTVFMRQKTVDTEQFTKLFFSNFQAFFELKPASMKVFRYIIGALKPDNDEIKFILDDCIAQTSLSKSTIYRALGELCAAQIIARGISDVLYYINPMVVFNGDRVTFATTYINKNFPEKYHTSKSSVKGTIDIMISDKLLE